ncbi:biotin--[acetyl-CoA-carboxylase] ligase [Thiocapsa rosea]|uniref:biotin--[biotin carboxyl-carrier protein] ligase n=1 Tax=Thiocapsa rosea TaxID=69360 RepID=A0A495V1U7_9GAMM|nr:biotin--[acetyl-CoA-carboxylase] ligase [Thiocapsa rosea]RKT43412.1 BirA family biotin operon repressor/biotin-[acetyl-CoA-carboxylase] ligase [Thiocapsa rosea]
MILGSAFHGQNVPPDLLDEKRLLAALSPSARRAIARLEIHTEIDSTNRYLMREAATGAPGGTLCLAECQTAGRGRLGRAWISPFGANLYLSMLWRYAAPPVALGGFSLVAGAVVADVLRRIGAEGLALKWPNDLLWDRRKLGGMLLEVAGEAKGPSALVVGIGINVRMTADHGRVIDQPWVDLTDVLGGSRVDRNTLAALIVDALIDAFERFGREGLTPYLALWAEFDAFRGEQARILLADREIRGRVLGIASDGALRLDTADGERRFHAGEVSLRREGEGER